MIWDGEHSISGMLAEALVHRLVLDQVARDHQRALQPLVEVEAAHLAAIQPAEVLQVQDDLGDLLDAVQSVGVQRLQVRGHRFGLELGGQRGHACELLGQLLVGGVAALQQPDQLGALGHHTFDLREPFVEGGQAALHVGKRSVDLVRDAGDHLPQGGHLLGLHQQQLGLLEVLEGLRELLGAVLDALLEVLVGGAERLVGMVDLARSCARAATARRPGTPAAPASRRPGRSGTAPFRRTWPRTRGRRHRSSSSPAGRWAAARSAEPPG